MRLIFVHGWSVTNTSTYGSLPKSIAERAAEKGIALDISHIHLGKYVSFHDEVSLDDIARAFQHALKELPHNKGKIEEFSCITHSTGGPVLRHWVDKYYGARKLKALPLKHLVMLAPANHGSSLAILGKKRVGRIKAWFSGTEPGQRVLDWLALGSEGQWSLNESWLSYRPARHSFYPFVLAGQGIDTKAYDFLNSYLTESGSDGVVRVAGANMNYRYFHLAQTAEPLEPNSKVMELVANKRPVRISAKTPLGVFHNFSHTGSDHGIMAINSRRAGHRKIASEVLDCLAVNSSAEYENRRKELMVITATEQALEPEGKGKAIGRYSMLVFRIRDDQGNVICADDYEIYLLAGPGYEKDELPAGFFVDRQLNQSSNSLVYYVNTDKMAEVKQGLFGLQVVVRPQKGFAYFAVGEFRSGGIDVDKVFAANETTYIDITMTRQVDKNVFRFTEAGLKPKSFKKLRPSGDPVD